MKNLPFAVILGFLIQGNGESPAGQWLQFRGPESRGISPGLNLPLNPDEARIPWKAALPGRGLSSPLVIGNRVVVTCSSGIRQDRLHVLCFDSESGDALWHRQFWATGNTTCQEKTCVAAPSPASNGRVIVAAFSSTDLICLDLEGRLQWLRGITHDHPNVSNSLGMASSPIILDETVVFQAEADSESLAVGIDIRTGLNRWQIDRPRMANWTSPLPLPRQGRTPLALLQSGKGISAVDSESGEVIWQYDEGASTIPSSTVHEDLVLIPSHGLTALSVSGGQNPETLWRSGRLRPGTASPIVLGNQVFVINNAGVLSCADLTSGERNWQHRLNGPFSASPVSDGAHLFAVNEAGQLYVVRPEVREATVIGTFELKETILATPALMDGAVILRSDQHLWKIAADSAL